MASVINTNMASLYAQKNLSGAQSALSTSVERLSSGLRINRAKDDAAGLGISEKLKSQIVALNQGVRNANDAVSMVQTAEGSLSEVSNILQRMKELAVQGRNESLSDVQRAYIADELTALKKEVNAIAERTSFNGMSLLKNALRTQVASAMGATNKMVEGAEVISGVSVQNLKVDGANVGTYTLTTQTATEIAAVSNVSAKATGNPLTARTITINAGDVFEGAKLTVKINGIEYSAVAGQDSSAESMATQLVAKLDRDYEDSVVRGSGANANQIQFSSSASLGTADISISMSSLEASTQVENIRSTVDSPYDAAATQRLIKLNDFDIIEGRKVVVTIGNPDEVAEFSTIVGAGATASSVADDLEELIDNHFSNVSAASGTITFTSSANLGMAAINLKFFETNAVASGLTISTVNDKASAQTARTIEINENDLDGMGASGRVFSLMIGDKEYSYKATGVDTDETIAYALSQLIDDDYAIAAGAAVAPTVTVTTPAETNAITFTALSAGETLAVAGLTMTANRNMTAAEVAERFANIEAGTTAAALNAETARDKNDSTSGDLMTFSGTLTGYSTGARSTNTVTFTATAEGDVADLASPVVTNTAAINVAAAGAVAPTVAEVTNGAAGVFEVDTVTFDAGGIKANVGVTVAGLTFTAKRDLTAAEVAEAFAGINVGTTAATLNADGSRDGPDYGTYSGTMTAFTSSAYDSATPAVITVTASVANVSTNVSVDIVDVAGVARAASSNAGYSALANTDGNTTNSESASVAFNAATMKAGDSITVGGLRFTAKSTVTQAQAAAAFANLFDGATSGDGTEYGVYSGELRGYNTGTSNGTTVVFTSTAQAGKNVPNLTASANPAVQGVSRTTNTITLTAAGAKLGLENVSLKVKDVADPGVFTLTANSDTGIAGTSQSINVGSIAAGASKSLVFDQLGVSFSLKNDRAVAVNNDTFRIDSSKLDTLSVTSAMDGEALFQVGAAVRDTVVIDGFKDIRITGASKNDTQAEREVFDNLYTTMTAIAGGDVDEATFATLETQVEEAITTVSTFRSYLGAQQNRIDYAIANLQAQSENITEANSRIRDTDYAAETANLTKTQIMQQAATAMLAQANQMPNVILALLK